VSSIADLRTKVAELTARNIKVMAIVGVAGTSETGSVDPLDEMADVAEEIGCHYHVDAAWGGPTLFSAKYKSILKGIERADSVTIDAHKQMYVPMGAGLVLFKEPTIVSSIEHHAEYIIRKGSKDLGSYTLEGSRPGMAMLLQSGLKIIGRSGYEILIDEGINKARNFADMINREEEFELVSAPELNILTYRFVPDYVQKALAQASEVKRNKMLEVLNRLTKRIQKTQRAHGKSFVSRTTLTPMKYERYPTVVFRVVLANPLTSMDVLRAVIMEQLEIASSNSCKAFMAELAVLCNADAA